jgi:hypothetical protein
MMMSRRGLLASVPGIAAALAVLAGHQLYLGHTIDVRDFGARGDGVTDDSQAIQDAVAALRSNDKLHFPRGTYRFAQRRPLGAAAIVIAGVSDVDIEFEPGAELLMDNLDPTSHTGTSHGLLVRGPASRISLRNVNIRWAAGAKRSLGDGIRVVGCPASGAVPSGWSGPRAPVTGITLLDCVVRASPQAGAIMLGVSDITVTGLRVADTGADGLHFNACRRARIDDYGAVNTGDDGLALVTYVAIGDVSVVGGRANGVRIAGANRVTVGGLRVVGVRSGSAVMLDSAEPGTDVGWNYVASRAVRVDDVSATSCDTGIHVLARPGGPGDQRFTDFDVQVDDANFNDCDNWAVRAESLTDHKLTGLRMENCSVSATSITGGNGGVGIDNAQSISLGTVSIRHAEPVVAFRAVNARRLAIDRLGVMISKSGQPAGTAPPCVSLDGSDGAINDMELSWPTAPSSWNAVRLSGTSQCGDDMREAPIVIKSLKITPPASNSALSCP